MKFVVQQLNSVSQFFLTAFTIFARKTDEKSQAYFFFFYRAPIDEGYKKEVVIDHNIVTADGLAVDWLYSHLYWTDTGTNSICMSDLDGNLVTTIITDHLEEPRAIALHPSKG